MGLTHEVRDDNEFDYALRHDVEWGGEGRVEEYVGCEGGGDKEEGGRGRRLKLKGSWWWGESTGRKAE